MGKTRRAAMRRTGVVALAALVAGAGCSAGDTQGAPPETTGPGAGSAEVLADLSLVSALQPFDACDDLLGHVKEQALARVTAYGLSGSMQKFQDVGAAIGDGELQSATDDAPATTAAPTAPGPESGRANEASPSGGVAGTDYSETNVQEAGVDEPDTVKSDGRRILAVVGERLQYVDVTGDAPVVAGSLALPDAGTAQIMVTGDRVLVISQSGYQAYDDAPVGRGASSSYPGYDPSSEVTLTLVDVGRPADMRVLTSVRIDGRSVSARLVDGRARIVTTASPTDLGFVYPSGPGGEDAAEATNRRTIEESTIDDWLPHVRTGTATDESGPTTLAVDCANVRHPKRFSGFDVLTVQTVDLGGDQITPGDATAILANGQTVYASASNLYVATPTYHDQPTFHGDGDDATTNDSAGATPPGTAVPGTAPGTVPDAPTTTVVDPDQDPSAPALPPQDTTSIHRFGIGDPGPAVYRASGEVAGNLLNQFSMSEHEDRLRVATTDGWSNRRSGAPESWVRVLEERDGGLTEVGSVGGLGRNEQIKSVRFIADRGYVVTFRQTDPLYTIDLSDPTAPRVAGELKILGYSAYLHPAGDGLLIGIGQDATEQGRATGTQVSLFDVSDAANPRRIQQHLVGVGSSTAEQDHHAFLWWGPTDLAVIPSQNYDEGRYFDGAIGFTITPDGITELGRISHPSSFADGVTSAPGGEVSDGGSPATTLAPLPGDVCDPAACAPIPPQPCSPSGVCPGYGGATAIDRAVVIGDRVYTVSSTGVLASRISDLSPIAGTDFTR